MWKETIMTEFEALWEDAWRDCCKSWKICQYRQTPGHDLKLRPPKYEAVVLPLNSWSAPHMQKAVNTQGTFRRMLHGRLIWQWKCNINIILLNSLLVNTYKMSTTINIRTEVEYNKFKIHSKSVNLFKADKTLMTAKKILNSTKIRDTIKLL
jgi:hypothetical protein